MKSDTATLLVVLLLVLQVVATALLWVLDVLSVITTGIFSVLLAADLIAFAMVLQIYRNPGSVEGAAPIEEPAPVPPAPAASAAPATPAPAPAAQPIHAAQAESEHPRGPSRAALPRIVHLGLPIASFLVLLVFAVVAFLPSDKTNLPIESTSLFIPIYLFIVVILVFGSMYLFKRIMDTEGTDTARH